MGALMVLSLGVAVCGPIQFQRHDIDDFPAGYQVAVGDINGDGKPDVIALSTDADRVDWYENPGWTRHPVARTDKNIDLALHDVDGCGRLEIALASGFYFNESRRGGAIAWLSRPTTPGQAWQLHPIAVAPVVHRLRWGDLDGDGKAELIHAPVFGPGSDGARDPKPAHLWAFRPPHDPAASPWDPWKIDETLTVLHGIHVADLDGDGRDEILTASFEGVFRFDYEGRYPAGHWKKVRLSTGSAPASQAPGASRGASEVAPGKFGPQHPFVATIEPWHGNQVVLSTPLLAEGRPTPAPGAAQPSAPRWRRRVLDDSLREGHALAVADLDGDGQDEIVAGWRAAGGGLVLYDPLDATGQNFARVEIDPKAPVEGLAIADLDGDGRLDLVAVAGRANKLMWYENRGR